MPKSKKSKKTSSTPRSNATHLNFKNIGILGGVLVIVVSVIIALKVTSAKSIRDSAMAQARQALERREGDLALRHLDRYLGDNPNDVEALDLKAEVLSKSAFSADRVLLATSVMDQLIRLDPDSPKRLETRRRLIELYLTYGEMVRGFADGLRDPNIEAHESRYLAAINAADELINYKDPKTGEHTGNTAAAHRLKAMAFMDQVPGLIVRKPEDSKVLGDAELELKKALQMDPGDYFASEKLVELYLIHTRDEAKAEKILDEMLTSFQSKKFDNPEDAKKASVNIRLSRFRAFYRSKKYDKAQAELTAALVIEPDNIDIRTSAAGLALQRNENAECRRQLEGIPAELQKGNLRVRFLRGALEFAERHPEEAIDQWKKGLSLVGGSDLDLTWRLASNLIQINRLVEARPLVDQYQRLAKPNDPLGIYLEGIYQEKEGHFNKAIELISKATNLVPLTFKSDTLMSLGHCYELIGDEKKAMFAYKQAVDLGGSSTAPRRAIARLYLTSNPARAIEELEMALSASKTGEILTEQEKAARNGSKEVKEVKEVSKGDPNILIDLIRIKMDRQMKLAKQERDFRDIAALLEDLRSVSPDNPAYQGLLAQYQSLDNKLDLAVKTLEETVKGPNRKRVESWLAWAEAYEVLGRSSDAIKVLDRAAAPDAAGDRAALRIMKARLLLRIGLASKGEEILTTNLKSVPPPELPELKRALGDLLQELGRRSEARDAYMQWAALAPESPFPALKLLSIAQLDGDEEAAKAGLNALEELGRSNEPYGLAARALQLLRPDPITGIIAPDRIEQAKTLVAQLDRTAPDFPVKFMIAGMIQESLANPKDPAQWREKLTKAGDEYRKSIKVGAASPALPKLIEIYMKLKDNDKLNLLKLEYDDGSQRHKTEMALEFDRLATMIALKLNDRDRAEKNLKEMLVARPESREYALAGARMYESNGKILEAETVYRELVKNRPQDSVGWVEWISFAARHRSAAEVARSIDEARQKYKGERPELFLALCYWKGKDIPNAVRAYQVAVDTKPDDLITLKSLIEFRDATNQGNSVEPVLRRILKLEPTNTWAARNLAIRLTNHFDPVAWAEAWALVAPGSVSSSDLPDDRLIRAMILARSTEIARRAEAVPAFASLANDLPVSNPIGIEARQRVSQAMLETDRPADAWSYIRPLSDDLSRANVPALAIAIEALARMGQGDEAEKRLLRLNNLTSNTTQFPISRAWVMQAQGKKEDAAALVISTYEKSEKSPDAESIGNSCFETLLKFPNLDAAMALAKKMMARSPKEIHRLARVQLERQELDDCLVSCQKSLEAGMAGEAIQYATSAAISRRADKPFLKKVEELGLLAKAKLPDNAGVFICLATIYHLLEQYDQEVNYYRLTLEKNPDNQKFVNNMAWTLCEGLNQPEEAYKKIEELIRREGTEAQYLDTRGVILTRLKKFDKAIEDLEKSVAMDPSALTYYHLARAYYKAGMIEKSRKAAAVARSKKLDLDTLDPTDRSDLIEVFSTTP